MKTQTRPRHHEKYDRIVRHVVQHSCLRCHGWYKIRHDLAVKWIRSAYRIRVRGTGACFVDVEARPVHTALDGLGGAGEDVCLILVHDALHVEIVPIHAQFFEDAGFVRRCAGVIVVSDPLEAVVWSCGSATGVRVSVGSLPDRRGNVGGDHLPVVIGVEMESAKVDVLEVEDGGEIFSGSAVVIEIPIMSSGPVVEVAVSAKGDEVVGVDGFDVLADLIGPCGQDLAAVALRFLTSSLRIVQTEAEKIDEQMVCTSLASSHAKIAGESLYLVTISLT